MKITNISDGPRGIQTSEGVLMLSAGETSGDFEASKGDVEAARNAGWFDLKGGPLDHDDNGEPGGSKPADPPALTGKPKAELIKIAKSEGAEIDDDMTNDDLRSAIELNREG